MIADILARSFYLFFRILEYMLLGFVLCTWILPNHKLTALLKQLAEPMLCPVRFLLRHSSFRSSIDLSPLITFIILTYLQSLFQGVIQ